MDEIKHLTNRTSNLQLNAALQKLIKQIRIDCRTSSNAAAGKSDKTPTRLLDSTTSATSKEVEFLKLQCLSDNQTLSQLAFQTFGLLIEEGTMNPAAVMSMFISMIPSATRGQLVALSEAVIHLLLLDLKNRRSESPYVCPFGVTSPQHPLIAFFQKVDTNVIDIVGKINGLCNDGDTKYRQHRWTFIRPVYLYVFCNPQRIADTSPLWTNLLAKCTDDDEQCQLVLEILGWCNISSEATLLQTVTMIINTIDCMRSSHGQNSLRTTHELCLYLANLLPLIIEHGFDPRPSINVILQQQFASPSSDYANVLIVSLCHSLPLIAPAHLGDMCALLRHLCIEQHAGNRVIMGMLLSGLINWIASPLVLNSECQRQLNALLRHVTGHKWRQHRTSPPSTTPSNIRVRYFHPNVALSVDLATHSERLCASDPATGKQLTGKFANARDSTGFYEKTTLYLCALFLMDNARNDCDAFGVAETLLKSVRSNSNVCIGVFMTWLYRLLHESDDQRMVLLLLRGLTAFGVVKENIPKIIGTMRSLSQSKTGRSQSLLLQLYSSLWKCEDRTFVYLRTELTKAVGVDDWELSVAKAKTIQTICDLKPSKHGAEMIVHLSNILNTCTNANGETASVIALQTIVGLCTSQTINVASTWSALRELFQAEQRIRPLIVQCEFYGQVPHLACTTDEYAACLDASLTALWTMVATPSIQPAVRIAALRALANYDYRTLTLQHVPIGFHPAIPNVAERITTAPATPTTTTPDEEPLPPLTGEFWPHLLRLCDDAQIAGAASKLIADFVQAELRTFRQHIYILGEGHVEPPNYNRLPGGVQSPLRAIVRALLHESNLAPYARDQHIIRYGLRALAADLRRPMPPLNWFFLVELMNADLVAADVRRDALRIAVHQQLHSESARQIVENYFGAFEPAAQTTDDEDVRHCVRLFGSAGRGLLADTVGRWMQTMTEFAHADGERNGFVDGCLFGDLLDCCTVLFGHGGGANGFDESNENYAIVVQRLAAFYGHFECSSIMFGKYLQLLSHLPEPVVDRLTMPLGWSEIVSAERMHKELRVREHLANASVSTKTLRWLNPAFDSVTKTTDYQRLLFASTEAVLGLSSDERDVCVWAMDLLCLIQSILTSPDASVGAANRSANIMVRLRLFFIVVCVRSGFDRLVVADSGDDRYVDVFPESFLHLVTHSDVWRENESRIYEFFYNMYITAANVLPMEYLVVIRNLLMCARSRPYFVHGSVWKKFVGLRK